MKSMATFNVQDAKTRLSELLKRVESGEHIVIARSGKPVAELRPVMKPALQFGSLSHVGDLGSSALEPLDEEDQALWGSGASGDPLTT